MKAFELFRRPGNHHQCKQAEEQTDASHLDAVPRSIWLQRILKVSQKHRWSKQKDEAYAKKAKQNDC
jgi:hypothetical protein